MSVFPSLSQLRKNLLLCSLEVKTELCRTNTENTPSCLSNILSYSLEKYYRNSVNYIVNCVHDSPLLFRITQKISVFRKLGNKDIERDYNSIPTVQLIIQNFCAILISLMSFPVFLPIFSTFIQHKRKSSTKHYSILYLYNSKDPQISDNQLAN